MGTPPMDHRERLARTLRGEAVDRAPIALWRHFYQAETSPERLAEALSGFERAYDWDLLKVNVRAGYLDEAWGNRYAYAGDESPPERVGTRIASEADLARIGVLSPSDGVLGEHLRLLQRLRRALPGLPLFMTIFSPLSVLGRLAGGEASLRPILSGAAGATAEALEAVTKTLEAYVRACLAAGADGVFYATTVWARPDGLAWPDYDRIARPLDERVLAASDGSFGPILHVCGSGAYVREMLGLPCGAVHWDASDPRNPSIGELRKATPRALLGGIDHGAALEAASPGRVLAQARQAWAGAGGRGLVLAAGCTYSARVPEGNLRALRAVAEELKGGAE